MEVIVLGKGAWGTALASLLEENKHSVLFWDRGKRIPSNSLVVSAIPTQALRTVLSEAGKPREIVFVNGAKGIEKDTHSLPCQIVNSIIEECDYLTLMGPSFSEEVVKKMPTLVNLGYRNESSARLVKSLFQTDYFRIRLTKSVRSLELSAAFKNIYAIACGVSEGLGFGINTRVKLMILALEELTILRQKLDYKIDEQALPASIGDLVLTCSSTESRNFRFGKFLVENTPLQSLEKVGATVEGYYTVESVPYFEDKLDIDLPLAHLVYKMAHIAGTHSVRDQFVDFVKSV